jgi:hypothetical protein
MTLPGRPGVHPTLFVTPAKAGVHFADGSSRRVSAAMDSGLRRNDGVGVGAHDHTQRITV